MAPQTTPEVCGMGHSMKRKEDPRFIRGQGNYVDDIQLPGMLYLDIVRSPFAHARIKSIDTENALKVPGVLAVITGETLEQYNLHWMPTLMSDTQMVLPTEKVMYQAQEVAAVVATDRYAAADGVEAVEVDYDPLPVVVDPFKALEPDAPVLRTDKEDKKDNHIFHWEVGDRAATEGALAGADVVVKQDIYIPRIHVASIETCGCVADFDRVMGKLKVYMTTQAPHAIRTVLALVAGHVGLSEEKIQVISPDIGGGFGGKVPVYPGYVLAIAASVVVGKPVKWVEDRMENLQAGLLRARLPPEGRARGDEGRHPHGAQDQDGGRPRLHGRRREPVEVPGRPVLHRHRVLRPEARLRRGGRRVHEQAAGRHRLPLLVPRDRGGPHHRAAHRHRGPRDRDGPGRAAPQELHPGGQVPLQVGAGVGVRQRRLPRRPPEGDGAHRVRRAAQGAGRQARAGRADGHRHLELHRDRRRRAFPDLRHPRPQDVRLVRDPRPSHRQGDGPFRHQVAGPGARDHLRAGARRGAGGFPPPTSRSRRATPTPRPTGWAPTPAARRRPPARPGRWPRARSATRRRRSPPTCWR